MKNVDFKTILVIAAIAVSAAMTSCKDEKTYTVTFNSNGGSAVQSQTVKEGMRVTEPDAPTRDGYNLDGWYTDNNSFNIKWNFAVNTVTANVTLFAKWNENDYTVAFNSNGGSAVTAQTVKYGSKATKPADPIRAGFVFGGWFTDNNTFANEWEFTVNTVSTDVILFAKWSEITFTVTFNSNSGSNVAPQTIAQGAKATKPADPTRAGFVFGGWFTDNDTFANEWDFAVNTVTADLTLYAKWISQYTVIFISNGGSTVTAQTVVAGGKASKPANPTRTGFVFVGWFTDNDTFANEWDFAVNTVTADLTLYTKWISQYTVTFNSNSGSAVTAQAVVDGGKASKPADPTRAGFVFGGWFTDNNTFANEWNFTVNTVTANVTLFAKWLNQYTVTFNSDGGSAVSSQTVVQGGRASRPANPTKTIPSGLYLGTLPSSYTFDGWFTSGSTTVFDFNTPITGNITLTAKWSLEGGGTHISTIAANDVATSVTYVNNNSGTYTLLMDRDVSISATQTLSSARNLTILGLGEERRITFTGSSSSLSPSYLFNINNTNASLTLGVNITLIGRNSTACVNVQAGNLTMKAGAKITGQLYPITYYTGVINVNGQYSSLTIEGGEISDNQTFYPTVVIDNNATFVMSGGRIIGNTTSTRSLGSVFLNSPSAVMRGGMITGNTSGMGDVFHVWEFTLSGNAEIGTLTLYHNNNNWNSAVTIGSGGFTGVVSYLNLCVETSNINTVVDRWTMGSPIPTVIYGANASILSRFTLGKFIGSNTSVSRNISPEYRLQIIGSEAKLVWQ